MVSFWYSHLNSNNNTPFLELSIPRGLHSLFLAKAWLCYFLLRDTQDPTIFSCQWAHIHSSALSQVWLFLIFFILTPCAHDYSNRMPPRGTLVWALSFLRRGVRSLPCYLATLLACWLAGLLACTILTMVVCVSYSRCWRGLLHYYPLS
jgi:hypothetical protein